MAKKTVIKQLLKYAPLRTELEKAMSMDESIKTNISVDMSEVENDNIVDVCDTEESWVKGWLQIAVSFFLKGDYMNRDKICFEDFCNDLVRKLNDIKDMKGSSETIILKSVLKSNDLRI